MKVVYFIISMLSIGIGSWYFVTNGEWGHLALMSFIYGAVGYTLSSFGKG